MKVLYICIYRAHITLPLEDIIQPAIQQESKCCAYAAVSTHIGYNLRASYKKKAINNIRLVRGAVVDHKRWGRLITSFHGRKVSRILTLLEEAQKNGVPLVNGRQLKLYIDSYMELDMSLVGIVDLMKKTLEEWSILAVLHMRSDYYPDGDEPYMGRKELLPKDDTDVNPTHAVVILGSYEDDSLFFPNEEREPLWVYQNSDGDKTKSSLGNKLNVLKHSLIWKAYVAHVYPTNPLLQRRYANVVAPLRIQPQRPLNEPLTTTRRY